VEAAISTLNFAALLRGRYPGRASLRVLAGQLVLRTVSVAVRAIRRPGASVHGHMADSVGARGISFCIICAGQRLCDGTGSSGL
jgi:hypothetical protein